MAKASYIGVTGVAKKDKKMYFGHAGVAKKVKKSYIGDPDGKARLWFSSGNPYYAFAYRSGYLDMRDNELKPSETKSIPGLPISSQNTSTVETFTFFNGKFYALYLENNTTIHVYESLDLTSWTEIYSLSNMGVYFGLISDGTYMYLVQMGLLTSSTSTVYYYTTNGTLWTKVTISKDSSQLDSSPGKYDLNLINGSVYLTVKSCNSGQSSFANIIYKINGSTKTKVATSSTKMASPIVDVNGTLAFTTISGTSSYVYYKSGSSFTSKKIGTASSMQSAAIGIRQIGTRLWYIPHNMTSTYAPYYADTLSGTWTKQIPGMSITDTASLGVNTYSVQDNERYKCYALNNLFYIYDRTTSAMYYTSDFASFTQVNLGANLYGINNAPTD